MKILFMAQDVTPAGRTGDAVHVRELVWNLAELGNEIWLIGRDLQGVSPEEYAEWNRALDKLKSHKNIHLNLLKTGFKLSFPCLKNTLAAKTAISILSKEKIDIIYSRSFNCALEAYLHKLFSVPLVLEINGLVDEEREQIAGRKTGCLKKNAFALSARASFAYPEKIITVTEKLKAALVEKYGVDERKIHVVPNGVDTDLFRPMDMLECRRKLGLPADASIVCFVGNLAPWQGVDLLIKAFSSVMEKHEKTLLLIVGDGKERKRLETLSKKLKIDYSVRFVGAVRHEDVPTYIGSGNICVATFTTVRNAKIGLSPLKIYEYLACAKPVITSDIQGIREIIENSNAGILTAPEDVDGISNAIERLLTDKRLAESMGINGREHILCHSWKSVARKVNDILTGVCCS